MSTLPRALRNFIVVAVWLSTIPSLASASSITGVVQGVISNPVRAGNVVYQTTPPVLFDNSVTAVVTGLGTNQIFYGVSTDGSIPGNSRVEFVGNSLVNAPADTEIALGTLTFFNGSSDLTSLIFGFDLTLSTSGVDPLVLNAQIITTSNTGTDVNFDADVIYLPGLGSSLNVFENNLATAIVYGKIVGDPQFELTRLEIAPGSEDGGFIANGVVPEPSSFMLLSIGLLGISRLGRKPE